jgi:hypothetical protein
MMTVVRRWLLGFTVAGVAVLITSTNSFAAMDATLSSDHARPNDWVLLLTDDNNGRSIYQDLSSEGPQPIYLASVTDDFSAACGGPVVARLAWRGNRGGVAFRVPGLQFGSYFLFMQTHGQCWRIGGTVAGIHGPLVLTIGGVPADNEDVAANWKIDSLGPPSRAGIQVPGQPLGLSLAIAVAVAFVGLVVVSAAWLRIRRPH